MTAPAPGSRHSQPPVESASSRSPRTTQVRHHETAALELQRLSASLRLHLSSVHPSCVVAPVDGVVYAVLPASSAGSARKRALAAARSSPTTLPADVAASDLTIAVAGPVNASCDLPRARADADAVLRTARRAAGAAGAGRARRRRPDAGADDGAARPGRRQGACGSSVPSCGWLPWTPRHGSDLVGTVEAWLDSFGDVNATADAVHVHPNTVRYRLRRMSEVGQPRPPMPRSTLRSHAADQAAPRPRITRPRVTARRAWCDAPPAPGRGK